MSQKECNSIGENIIGRSHMTQIDISGNLYLGGDVDIPGSHLYFTGNQQVTESFSCFSYLYWPDVSRNLYLQETKFHKQPYLFSSYFIQRSNKECFFLNFTFSRLTSLFQISLSPLWNSMLIYPHIVEKCLLLL